MDHSFIRSLFSDAKSKNGLEYIFTLLRVEGIDLVSGDQLLGLYRELLPAPDDQREKEISSQYCSLAGNEEPLSLIANLLNCILGHPYSISPFDHLSKGQYPNKQQPTVSEIVHEVHGLATRAGRPELAQAIAEAYTDDIVAACLSQVSPDIERLRHALKRWRAFLAELLQIYFEERLKYKSWPKLHKMPQFEVLELLVNDDQGLCGFRMHFSNGSSASFERHPNACVSQNLSFNPYVGFMVGLLDELKPEWRIGEKRLHEIGLPGRYNKLGEWKPIIYPGDADSLLREAFSQSEDRDVQGALFYIMSTGHRVIEFVVRTKIDMPSEWVNFSETLHLWKCPLPEEAPYSDRDIRIYDGWVKLDSIEPEDIRHMIALIGVAVNRMAFAFNSAADWRVKYRSGESNSGLATPSEQDMHVLDSLFRDFPATDDAILLDAAIDWYTRGKSSQNVLTAFLCYYVAIESVAVAIADGKADFGLGYRKGNKAERRQRRNTCIQEKHNQLYASDPARFVSEAYFECITGLKEKTRRVADMVFGKDHPYIKVLFEKEGESHSLSGIRSEVAHGGLALIDRDHERLVRKHIDEMARISKEFLTRIIFFLKPGDSLPSWSNRFRGSMHFGDPRATLFTTREDALPNSEWRIKPEWCD